MSTENKNGMFIPIIRQGGKFSHLLENAQKQGAQQMVDVLKAWFKIELIEKEVWERWEKLNKKEM